MIPHDYITAWREQAPWVLDSQVEQDLVISRALVDIFSDPHLGSALAFRGGTALYKLFLRPPARYSEDIDLVQVRGEPIGPTLDALRAKLDPWLGRPHWKQNEGRVTLNYRFNSEDATPLPLKLKVEINSREHFAVFGFSTVPFSVSSRWFVGSAGIVTYQLDELLATKFRALYQRRKGRDLFDLAMALDHPAADPARIVKAFSRYMEHEEGRVSRAQYEQNIADKMESPQFTADISPLLASGYTWNMVEAAQKVSSRLIALLPGEPWKRK